MIHLSNVTPGRSPDRKNWTLTLTFWALMIFVAILTAVSVGASLSQPY